MSANNDSGLLQKFLEPDVERHLLTIEGEVVIDEVTKHWAASLAWYILTALSIPLFLLMIPAGRLFWIPMLLGLGVLTLGLWKCHSVYMDRFVITNMRVFRVHGILNQNLATMPMARILDISLTQPFLGQLLGYGHFVFESAAQDQGLRDIKFVGRPEQRDQKIQRVIQRSGLRVKADLPRSEWQRED